jgi:glutamate-1-semialdehyde aminotransferase
MQAPSTPTSITVVFHFGAEHTSFDADPTETLAALKQRALGALNVVFDPSLDYILSFDGHDIVDETQSLSMLLGGHSRPKVVFHIKKRPKGGSRG